MEVRGSLWEWQEYIVADVTCGGITSGEETIDVQEICEQIARDLIRHRDRITVQYLMGKINKIVEF